MKTEQNGMVITCNTCLLCVRQFSEVMLLCQPVIRLTLNYYWNPYHSHPNRIRQDVNDTNLSWWRHVLESCLPPFGSYALNFMVMCSMIKYDKVVIQFQETYNIGSQITKHQSPLCFFSILVYRHFINIYLNNFSVYIFGSYHKYGHKLSFSHGASK